MTGPDIRTIRQSLGLTQKGLAEALGVTRLTVNRYEMGHQHIPLVIELAIEALRNRRRRHG